MAENNVENWDLVIIGGGPAGLAAGIYGGRARLKTLILEKGSVGGRVFTTREIVNYPSVKESTGPELMAKMEDHAKAFGVEIRKQKVTGVDFSGTEKIVKVRKTDYHAKAVIIATGTTPRVINVPGEVEFTGNGVSYCATCDAAFYQDQHVAVLGSGDQAVEESEYIAKFANRVTLIVIHDEGIMDCNQMSQERAMKNPKLDFVWNSTIGEVYGDGNVQGVKLKNLSTGELTDFPCDGVFFFCGMVPQTDFLGDALPNSRGWLMASDESMGTPIPGVFVAGDVRVKFLRQVSTAISDGASAATAAERYITEMQQFNDEVVNSADPVMVAFWDSTLDGSIDALGALRDANREGDNLKFIELDVSRKNNVSRTYGIVINDENKAEAKVFGGQQ